jgi:hypothetical protein
MQRVWCWFQQQASQVASMTIVVELFEKKLPEVWPACKKNSIL